MKFNKWTLGLAAVGAVSMASAVRADEAPKMSQLNTALSNTTISGYVDVAAQYNAGNQAGGKSTSGGSQVPAGLSNSKIDNFSLNDVDIAFDKPQDDSPWASGYHIDLNVGTDAVGVASNQNALSTAAANSGTAIRQGYVVVRTPVGNGIDWKVGVQDDIIGYEGNTDSLNPNYTRSIGYSVEPTTLLGFIGTYKISNVVTVQGGIADATTPGANSLSDKAFAAAVAFTAPDSWGWIKGGSLNLGTLLNLEKGGQDNYYAGLTIPTPLNALKVGASFDLVSVANAAATNPHNDSGWIAGIYGNFQATDKLAFNLRGEYYNLTGAVNPYSMTGTGVSPNANGLGEEITATVSYNLWANVTSRVEARWDHSDQGVAFGNVAPATPTSDSFLVAVNLIYTF